MIKFISLEETELESGTPAKIVTFDVDGTQVKRKIDYNTPVEKIDQRIQDLAEGLAIEFAENEPPECQTSFKEGQILIAD